MARSLLLDRRWQATPLVRAKSGGDTTYLYFLYFLYLRDGMRDGKSKGSKESKGCFATLRLLHGGANTRPPDATPPPWGGTTAGGTAAGGAAEGAGAESVRKIPTRILALGRRL